MSTNKGNGAIIGNAPCLTCHGCGKGVDLQLENVLMDVVTTSRLEHKQAVAWHHDCYEDFLNSGKEC